MIYASSGQINCIVPYEVSGLSSISVQVKYLAQPSNTVTLGVTGSAPGVFSSTGTGTGQGAIMALGMGVVMAVAAVVAFIGLKRGVQQAAAPETVADGGAAGVAEYHD